MAARGKSDELIDELITASRALVGAAVRSIAAAPVEITVAQHRLLVLLAAHGPQSVGQIAEQLGVNPSNASRHCDRLQRLDLVRRSRSADDGRVVEIGLTEAGRRLLDAVTAHRREALAAVVHRVPAAERGGVFAALRMLNAASDELSDADWTG
ncbi:MAG: MarR family winged helix-turn-helix transcriptional regulator [Solirubrobacteraceae bacterium]